MDCQSVRLRATPQAYGRRIRGEDVVALKDLWRIGGFCLSGLFPFPDNCAKSGARGGGDDQPEGEEENESGGGWFCVLGAQTRAGEG